MIAVREATQDSLWGGKRIDLSKKKLSVKERMYIMNLGMSKILPAKDIAQYFTLKADRLRQWVNRVKKGKVFKEKEGAPRKLTLQTFVVLSKM